MKVKYLFLIFNSLFFVLLALLSVISISYAYFDDLNKTDSSTCLIGEWDEMYGFAVYETGFETYEQRSNTYTGNFLIDGKNWTTNCVITGDSVNDNKDDTRSLRFYRTAYMESLDGFRNISLITFNMGKAIDSPTSGNPYKISVKDATSGWEEILSGSMPNTFTPFSIDMETLIAQGFILDNGVVVDETTVLYIRIDFTGKTGGSKKWQDMNLDSLKIEYRE